MNNFRVWFPVTRIYINENRERFLCVCLVVFKWPIQRFQPYELTKGRAYCEPLGGEGHPFPGKYRKIPKISPRAYIFQRSFLRGLFLEGLI